MGMVCGQRGEGSYAMCQGGGAKGKKGFEWSFREEGQREEERGMLGVNNRCFGRTRGAWAWGWPGGGYKDTGRRWVQLHEKNSITCCSGHPLQAQPGTRTRGGGLQAKRAGKREGNLLRRSRVGQLEVAVRIQVAEVAVRNLAAGADRSQLAEVAVRKAAAVVARQATRVQGTVKEAK